MTGSDSESIEPKDTRWRAVASLRNRDFRRYSPTLVSESLGAQIQQAAVLWQIYELTNSPLQLGLTGLAEGIPIFVFSLLGGVLADRINRRKFIVVAQALAGLLNLAVAGLTLSGLIQVWHLYLFVMCSSALNSMNSPARTALIGDLVPRHLLFNALALTNSLRRMARLIGPAFAGFFIASMGLSAMYALNGLVYLVTLTALASAHIATTTHTAKAPPLQSLLEGLAFVRARSIIMYLIASDVLGSLFGSYRVLLPVLAVNFGVGPEGMGLLLGAPAAGGLIGVSTVLALEDVRYKGLAVAGAIVGYSLSLVLLAASPWFPLCLFATACLGGFDGAQSVLRNTVIQTNTPNALRGRVTSCQTMITMGMPALGRAQSGFIAQIFGPALGMIVGAGICAALMILMVVKAPEMRKSDL